VAGKVPAISFVLPQAGMGSAALWVWIDFFSMRNVILPGFSEFPSFVFIHIGGGILAVWLFGFLSLLLFGWFPRLGSAVPYQCDASTLSGLTEGTIPVVS
jgi:hypothetical protein